MRFLLGFFILFFSQQVLAEVAIEGETDYVRLVQGVYVDKKYPDLPDDSLFKFENTTYKKYVDVIYDNDRKVMRFKPKRKGNTTIRLVNKKDPHLIIKQIRVDIQEKKLDQVAEEIRSLLGEIEGIVIKVFNDRVVIDGYILLPKDLDRIAKVMALYPDGTVSSLVRLSPLTKRKIADRIEAEIDNPNIYVTVVNDFFMLEGVESYSGEAKRAKEIAEAHISDKVSRFAEGDNPTQVKLLPVIKDSLVINNIRPVQMQPPPAPKMIQFVVHYVQLSKTYSKGFNFTWAPTIGDATSLGVNAEDLSTANVVTSLTATITNLLPRLDWARQHGHVRVLDTMNVIVQEEKTGSVESAKTITAFRSNGFGGTTPFPVNANVKTEVVNPKIDPQKPENVNFKVTVNIGEIIGQSTQSVDTAKNTVTTHLTVRDKQSAALGGLMRSFSGTDYNRDPASPGGVPLFKFHASKNLERNQSQFVIFITPFIKENASKGIEKVKRKFRLEK